MSCVAIFDFDDVINWNQDISNPDVFARGGFVLLKMTCSPRGLVVDANPKLTLVSMTLD